MGSGLSGLPVSAKAHGPKLAFAEPVGALARLLARVERRDGKRRSMT